jgi:hypothetical protein
MLMCLKRIKIQESFMSLYVFIVFSSYHLPYVTMHQSERVSTLLLRVEEGFAVGSLKNPDGLKSVLQEEAQ